MSASDETIATLRRQWQAIEAPAGLARRRADSLASARAPVTRWQWRVALAATVATVAVLASQLWTPAEVAPMPERPAIAMTVAAPKPPARITLALGKVRAPATIAAPDKPPRPTPKPTANDNPTTSQLNKELTHVAA
ncbi:MAG: hypothetical protein AAGF46_01075 [Pseudomonadota bacterium]